MIDSGFGAQSHAALGLIHGAADGFARQDGLCYCYEQSSSLQAMINEFVIRLRVRGLDLQFETRRAKFNSCKL